MLTPRYSVTTEATAAPRLAPAGAGVPGVSLTNSAIPAAPQLAQIPASKVVGEIEHDQNAYSQLLSWPIC